MLSSAWLCDTADDDNVEQDTKQQAHHHPSTTDTVGDPTDFANPMVPEQFLEVDINNFYLPTPPESSELWQDNLLPTLLIPGKTARANVQRRLYCSRCTKAFSRTDSLRRHEKLYCRNNKKPEQQQQQQQPQDVKPVVVEQHQPAPAPSWGKGRRRRGRRLRAELVKPEQLQLQPQQQQRQERLQKQAAATS